MKVKSLILGLAVCLFEYAGYLSIKNKEGFDKFVYKDYLLRTATSKNDVKKALEVHRLSPDTPPPEERLYRLYRLFGKKLFFIAEKDHEVVGYCFFKVTPMVSKKGLSRKAFLILLGVHPDHRNKGIATALIHNSINILKKYRVSKIYLWF